MSSSSPLIDRLDFLISRTGWIGVDRFFVLSGFLITGILYDAKESNHYFRNFYVRRVLRIFPLYYGALIIFLVVLPWLRPGNPAVQSMTRDAVWYWTYLSNVRIAHNGGDFGAIGHFWSLAIEEQFYLIWPVVVLALRRRQLQACCLACVIGALFVRVGLNVAGNETAAFVLTPARIDALAVGAYLALSARGPAGLNPTSRWASIRGVPEPCASGHFRPEEGFCRSRPHCIDGRAHPPRLLFRRHPGPRPDIGARQRRRRDIRLFILVLLRPLQLCALRIPLPDPLLQAGRHPIDDRSHHRRIAIAAAAGFPDHGYRSLSQHCYCELAPL